MKKTLITLIALAGLANADFTWNGGDTITQDLWQTESSWSLSDGQTWPTGGHGPGTQDSNAWSPITISGATGSVTALMEGWELNLDLSNGTDLTIANLKKLQSGCSITIDQSSTLTISNFQGTNRDGDTTFNNSGVFNMTCSGNQYEGGNDGGFIVKLDATGIMNLTSSNTQTHNVWIKSLSATLTADGGTVSGMTTGGHQILTRNLITLNHISLTSSSVGVNGVNLTSGIAGIDTLVNVGDEDLTNAAVGSYKITKDENGYSVSYVVPEPAAASLSLLGLVGLAMRRRRK